MWQSPDKHFELEPVRDLLSTSLQNAFSIKIADKGTTSSTVSCSAENSDST